MVSAFSPSKPGDSKEVGWNHAMARSKVQINLGRSSDLTF
jgi:hypothetical protein